jgi:hypothetical protein
MAEFWTRCGQSYGHELQGLTVVWQYENGEARFDGAKWSFKLKEEVRA